MKYGINNIITKYLQKKIITPILPYSRNTYLLG